MKLPQYLFALLLFLQLGLKAQNTNIYLIKSPVNSLVMEVDNKEMGNDGVKVYLKEQNGKDTQKWIITKIDDLFLSIVNLANGKAMSISSSSQNIDGNPLILNSPNSSDLQKWSLSKSFTTGRVIISNRKNSKVLVPYKYTYRNAAPILLNRSASGKNQEWLLVPVKEDNNDPPYEFSGIYKNEATGLNMEIKNMGKGIYKVFFNGNCKDESLNGSISNSGALILPLRSSNNARLEIRNTGNRLQVKVINMGQLSSRSYGKCNGGMMEGYYRK